MCKQSTIFPWVPFCAFSFLKKLKNYCLFTFGWIIVAAHGLFFSCGGHSSHGGGVSCCRVWALELAGSVAVLHGLSCLQHVGPSWTSDCNCVPCIGKEDSLPVDHQGIPPPPLLIPPCIVSIKEHIWVLLPAQFIPHFWGTICKVRMFDKLTPSSPLGVT